LALSCPYPPWLTGFLIGFHTAKLCHPNLQANLLSALTATNGRKKDDLRTVGERSGPAALELDGNTVNEGRNVAVDLALRIVNPRPKRRVTGNQSLHGLAHHRSLGKLELYGIFRDFLSKRKI
jgi:hypothetical protein